jgi:methylphosphotriester-DNA--protein-cysteine methyltransferase
MKYAVAIGALMLWATSAQAGDAEFRACVRAKVAQLEAKRDPHLMHWFATLDKTRAGEKTFPRDVAVTSVFNRVVPACRRYK